MLRFAAMRRTIGALILVIGAVAAAPAKAQPDDPVLAALQVLQGEKLVVIEALRAGDVPKARYVLRRLEHNWRAHVAQVPAVRLFAEPGLGRALAAFGASLERTRALVEIGAAEEAAAEIAALPRLFDDWRAARRFPLFSDCIAGFVRVFDELTDRRFAGAPPRDLQALALAAGLAIDRCDADADARTRGDTDFRGLVDRFRASLSALQGAIGRGDHVEVERHLREQRRIERQLAYRFG